MGLGKAKLLAGFVKESGIFFMKRARGDYPEKIESIIVDLDYTILNTLTAYSALKKLLGLEKAKEEYAKQKQLVKEGKADFTDVKFWGHKLQVKHGWTKYDWENIADAVYR